MNDELIAYYVNLLILQYQGKPKARAFIQALITEIMIYDLAIKVRDGFNIDTAIGAQLDILGKYIGCDRTVTGTTFDRTYFGFIEYGDIAPYDFASFMEYSTIIPDVNFRDYKESNQSLYDLNDDEYRMVLKLKIIQNIDVASMKTIDDFVAQFFGSDVLVFDNYNMSILYIFTEARRRLVTIAQSEDLLPRPAGVRLSISFSEYVSTMFGFSEYGETAPDYMISFIEYGDTTTTGGWLTYGG